MKSKLIGLALLTFSTAVSADYRDPLVIRFNLEQQQRDERKRQEEQHRSIQRQFDDLERKVNRERQDQNCRTTYGGRLICF